MRWDSGAGSDGQRNAVAARGVEPDAVAVGDRGVPGECGAYRRRIVRFEHDAGQRLCRAVVGEEMESDAADAHAVRAGTLETEPRLEELRRAGGVAAPCRDLGQREATAAGGRMMGLAGRRGRELDQDA